jgi:hypothetical protein
MKKFLLMGAFVAGLIPSISYSWDFTDCNVVTIIAEGANNGQVALSCNINNVPICGAQLPAYFGFDKSTEEGKQYLSIVLTAFASGAKVSGAVDHSSCSPYQGNVALLKSIGIKK